MIVCSSDVAVTQNNLLITQVDEKVDGFDKKNEDAWYLNSVVLNSANGKNSNYYGAAQPSNPKNGDLWFVYDTNGQVIDMLRYISDKWVSEVDLTTGQKMIEAALELAKRIDNDKLELKNAETLWKADISTASSSIMGSVNGIQSRVSNIENGSASVITQLSNQINLKVGKGDVISQINLEADSATIKSKAIVLAGDTTVTGTFAVPSAQITGKLTANQIAVTQLSALTADLGSVTAGNIRGVDIYGSKFRSSSGSDVMEITGSKLRFTNSSDQYVDMSATGFYGYNSGGSERFRADKSLVTSAALGTSNSNVYLAPDSNNEVRVVNVNSIPSDGAALSYAYRPIRALGYRSGPGANFYVGTDGEARFTSVGFNNEGEIVYRNARMNGLYSNFVDVNSSTGTHLYLRPTSSGEVRVTNTGTTDSYTYLRSSGLYSNFLDINTGTHIYLRPSSSGVARVTTSGSTSTYRPIQASSFDVSSSYTYKQDITEMKRSALDIVDELKVYEYRMKSDVEAGIYDLWRIGLIAEYSPQVSTDENMKIDTYKMQSLHWKATQELYSLVKGHEMTIGIQNNIIDDLTQRLEKLETKG